MNFNPYYTGYEYNRISLSQLEEKEKEEIDKFVGLVCEKCNNVNSEKWYVERIVENYLPNARIICENCI